MKKIVKQKKMANLIIKKLKRTGFSRPEALRLNLVKRRRKMPQAPTAGGP